MKSYQEIKSKLEAFSKRYYTNRLLTGCVLFVTLALLIVFMVLAVEYFLWLNSTWRLLLLLLFVGLELFLLYRYILTPLFFLLRIKTGISNKEASLLIGKHFPAIDDRLYNLLELAEDNERSELLLASIEQRSEDLKLVPFGKAVDLREGLRYAWYISIPLGLFALVWLSGNVGDFFGSTNRIVNYDLAYEQPAPFSFNLVSDDLSVLIDRPHTIKVMTEGEVRPEAVYIVIQGERLQLRRSDGVYSYTFTPPLQSVDFFFTDNNINSKKYRLEAKVVPSIADFEVELEFPRYLNRKSEVLRSTGNALLPEGTRVSWKVRAQNTERIDFITTDTTMSFTRHDTSFELSKSVYRKLSYEVATSNGNVQEYERLSYTIDVIRDAYPTLKVMQELDSLDGNRAKYSGEASDDYGLATVKVVYYPVNEEDRKGELLLETPTSNFTQFYYVFPSGLDLEQGLEYSYYFEAVDNDGIHSGKSVKSQVFSMKVLDADELRSQELQSQQKIIDNMDRSLEIFKEQKEALREINKGRKEKKELNFNDQRQIKDFLRKQQQQESRMQKFSKELKENLTKSKDEDRRREMLKERLERQEIEAKKNEKLLEELNKIADKINKEELKKRLEDLGKKQQNSERNLEQLVELTKRYYVTEKTAQLANELEKLAEEQKALAEKEGEKEAAKKEQQELMERFDELAKELEELVKDNDDLKKPMDLDIDKQKEEGIKEDQKEALEEMENADKPAQKEGSESKSKQKQKSAAQKMKEMSDALQKSSAGGGGGSSVAEDADMLRQILDNLVTFSFKQERLFETLESSDSDIAQFSGNIKKQKELRELFGHVDDSLFSLSLRRAELSEFVNEQITEVYYNIDKALESIAENQLYQGVSYQKYVLKASNELSGFLADILDNMQQSMQSGEGEGEGQGFQLPDIIKEQGELKKKMEGKGSSGKGKEGQGQEGQVKEGKGKEGQGKEGGQQGAGKEGGQGPEGQKGKDGKGKNGKGGDKAGGKGSKGKEDKGGQGGGNGEGGDAGPSEEELKEIYEIYKEQQLIRAKLEDQLQDMINNSDRKLGAKLVRQMEEFENDLLENGITQQGLSKMNTIQYELLKLENAAMKKGKKEERESKTNIGQFNRPIRTRPKGVQEERKDIEIINRQALPLRQNFKNKVKEYFERND